MKFKAQIWEINFLGPGKEKGRVEGGERGGVVSSRRSVFPNGWLDKKRGILAPSEGARKEQYKIYLKVTVQGLASPPQAQVWKSLVTGVTQQN